ncbi:MAG TPA: CaiB/BaiF CoA-transferase family protein [Sphingomonas sp.]|nr:CaiB/BaiF CoA-transferase family protein [Sphingomonas sp.]
MTSFPLTGIRIIEIAGIGPAPFCGMMLADHGAEVIRVERPDTPGDPRDPLLRARAETIALDLKSPEGIAELRSLAHSADGLIEGFRPGVMERLGLGPDVLHADTPRLVYGRMTGWGQTGPRAQDPGHDIDYIAVSGTLHALGPAGDKPVPPINLVGDFGGGAMMLAFGMLAGLLHARATGEGLVVDAAMTEGSALLMSMMWGFRATGRWPGERGTNIIDGGAPFYDTYECADGRFIAVGAIEPQFYAELRAAMGLDGAEWDAQFDRALWPARKTALAERFATRTRDQWCAAFADREACVVPVLDWTEAPGDPHNVARGAFIERDGVVQPAPAPRFAPTARPLDR